MSAGRESYFRYWGKARSEHEGPKCHLLPYHCLDVAAVAGAWLDGSASLRRAFAQGLSLREEVARAWVIFFCALHDLGKFDVRFQLKARVVAVALWSGFSEARGEDRFDHGRAGYAWFAKEAEAVGFSVGAADAAMPWVQRVTGHHGVLPRDPEMKRPLADPSVLHHDADARRGFVQAMADVFLAPAGLGLGDVPDVCPSVLAGFCSVCDWLGSNEDEALFPYVEAPGDLRAYLESRHSRATLALVRSGLLSEPSQAGGVSALLGPADRPRGVQTLVDQWAPEPGLTLIEAPTGSGKTEAALAYAWRLLASGEADSIVFALPTQATANAMLERIEKIAPKLFPTEANVVLAHGKARYHEGFLDLRRAAAAGTAQGREEAQAQCATWLATSRKRVFLGQLGVCTVDQVLLSVLPVRHNFVRAFGVRKSVLIVDEVHAYDSYMLGLLYRVLEGQKEAGGSAVLLSATLPGSVRRRLLSAWGAKDGETSGAYPLITQVGASAPRPWTVPPEEQPPPRSVAHLACLSDDLLPPRELLSDVAKAARAGACVAIVVNLVADAQAIARTFRDDLGMPADLFHSRYRFRDRKDREAAVLSSYGKGRPDKVGRVLVATQVVEQSLDLDFDWMVTQLCPTDALFQRIGRLHRHRRKRPQGYDAPRFSVIVPTGLDFGTHAAVYPDVRTLWRTQQLLASSACLDFPGAYRDWIERVYDEEPWPEEPDAMTKAADDFYGERMAAFQQGRQLPDSVVTPFADTDAKVTVLTRDGEMNRTVLPVLEQGGRRLLLDGQTIDSIDEWRRDETLDLNAVPVPASWQPYLPPADDEGRHILAMRAESAEQWAAETERALFRYSTFYGLERLNT